MNEFQLHIQKLKDRSYYWPEIHEEFDVPFNVKYVAIFLSTLVRIKRNPYLTNFLSFREVLIKLSFPLIIANVSLAA